MEVLVLDASFQPLSVISSQKLVCLLSKQRVTFITPAQEETILGAFENRMFPEGPVIVKLLRSVRVPHRLMRANKMSLMLRDDSECQYCGIHLAPSVATIDHVNPTSKGGSRREWTNLVIACKRCNHRKGNKTLAQSGMKLRRQPAEMRTEYFSLLLLRYPRLKEAYEALFAPAPA